MSLNSQFKFIIKVTRILRYPSLENLIHEVEKNDNYDAKRNIAFFSSRCLEFLVPTPRNTNKITKKTIAVIFLFHRLLHVMT